MPLVRLMSTLQHEIAAVSLDERKSRDRRVVVVHEMDPRACLAAAIRAG